MKTEDTIKKLKEARDSLYKDWCCQAGREFDDIERKRLYNILHNLIRELENGQSQKQMLP